jgi:hypothetical protein
MTDVAISSATLFGASGIVRYPLSKGPFTPGTKGYIQHNFGATTAPGVGDDDADKYSTGSWWYDTTANNLYICKSASTGAAVWLLVGDADQAAIGALSPTNDDIIQRKAGVWTNRTIAQLISDLLAGGLNHPGYVSGNWFWPFPRGTRYAAGTALTAASGRFLQFYIGRAVTISTLGVHITTLATSGNIQLAIYANDATTGRPTGSELAKTASISTTSTGVVNAAISGGNVTLQPGWYWMGINADATAGGTAICKTLDAGESHMSSTVGSATQADISFGASNSTEYVTTSLTYGTWGDLTSATWAIAAGTGNAALMLKVA